MKVNIEINYNEDTGMANLDMINISKLVIQTVYIMKPYLNDDGHLFLMSLLTEGMGKGGESLLDMIESTGYDEIAINMLIKTLEDESNFDLFMERMKELGLIKEDN